MRHARTLLTHATRPHTLSKPSGVPTDGLPGTSPLLGPAPSLASPTMAPTSLVELCERSRGGVGAPASEIRSEKARRPEASRVIERRGREAERGVPVREEGVLGGVPSPASEDDARVGVCGAPDELRASAALCAAPARITRCLARSLAADTAST